MTRKKEKDFYQKAKPLFLFVAILFLIGCQDQNQPEYDISDIRSMFSQIEKYETFDESYLQTADSSYNLSKKKGYVEGMAQSLYFKGEYHYQKRENLKALKYYGRAAKLAFNRNFNPLEGTIFNRLGNVNYRLGRYRASITSFEKAVEIRRAAKDTLLMSSSLNNLAFVHWQISSFDKALILYRESLAIREALGDPDQIATTVNGIGAIYFQRAIYDSALTYFHRALDIRQKLDDPQNLALLSCNIGLVHQNTNSIERAKEYFNDGINFAKESGDNQAIGYALNCYGKLFQSSEIDSALGYFHKSLSYYEKDEYLPGILLNYRNIATTFFDIGKYEEAKKYILKGLRLGEEKQIYLTIAETKGMLGNLYKEQGNYELAKKNYLESNEKAMEMGVKTFLLDNNFNLSKIYAEEKDYYNAWKALREYENYREQVENEEMNKSLSELKSKFEVEKYQRKLLSQQFENDRQQLFLGASLFALLTFGAMVIILIRMNKKKRKTNKLLELKNKKIEDQKIELSDKNEELVRLNIMKDRFISIIAHDLKNPFGALMGYSSMLNDDIDDLSKNEIKQFAAEIDITAKKTYKLLENLLTWASSRSGNIDYNPRMINLSSLVDSTFELVEVQAKVKNISLKNTIGENQEVFADDQMVELILRNILTNSIKFSPEQSKVTLSSFEETDWTTVVISDEGVGMDQETINSLFDVDNKITSAGTNGEKGTGLGLVICKEFADQNHADIWVKSEKNKGSSFFLKLPKSREVIESDDYELNFNKSLM